MITFLINRIFFLLVLSLLVGTGAYASDKKGVGLADLNGTERIRALNLAWYYTWKPYPIKDLPEGMFVPMVWGGHRLDSEVLEMKKHGKVPLLLAINEPDKRKQANMSVVKVLRAWPEISNLAEQVSSPAPAGAMGPWLEKFYRMANKQGLRYDFLAIHLYTPPNVDKFLKKVDAVYEKYQTPIWITEFAVADWQAQNKYGSNRYSEDQVLKFMKEVLPELEKRHYVLRYAWFGAGKVSLKHEQVRTSRLFEKDGSLTSLGTYYSQFKWQKASNQTNAPVNIP